MKQTASSCVKQHPDLPLGYRIVRCVHGAIGKTRYAVVEATSTVEKGEGVFVYSEVPSRLDGYSLVCMIEYDIAGDFIRDSAFKWFLRQFAEGRKPLHYVMHCKQNIVVGINHSDESRQILQRYARERFSGLVMDASLLFGRYGSLREELN